MEINNKFNIGQEVVGIFNNKIATKTITSIRFDSKEETLSYVFENPRVSRIRLIVSDDDSYAVRS